MTEAAIIKPQEAPVAPERRAEVVVFREQDGREVPALVKLEPNGRTVRSMMATVSISDQRGECDLIWSPRHREKRLMLSITGYRKCNQFVGVGFKNPERVAGESGEWHPNPWFYRDPETDALRRVRIRKLGVGMNAGGNWIPYDYTLEFDLPVYFAQDAMSKWRGKANDAVKSWGRLVAGKVVSAGTEIAMPLPSGMGTLLLDATHKDVADLLAEHINRQKYAGRLADSMCERNILKRFIPVTYVPLDGKVRCVQWAHIHLGQDEMSRIAEEAQQGRVKIGDQEIETVREFGTVSSPEEVDAAVASDEDIVASETPEEDDHTPGVGAPKSTVASSVERLPQPEAAPAPPPSPAPAAASGPPTEADRLAKAKEEIRDYCLHLSASAADPLLKRRNWPTLREINARHHNWDLPDCETAVAALREVDNEIQGRSAKGGGA